MKFIGIFERAREERSVGFEPGALLVTPGGVNLLKGEPR